MKWLASIAEVTGLPSFETLGQELDVPLVTYAGERLDVVHPTREGYETLAAALLARIEAGGYLD